MRSGWMLVGILACGEPAPHVAPPQPPALSHMPAPAPPCAEWRYALVAPAQSPIDDITAKHLGELWRAGRIAASADTRQALRATLGEPTGAVVPPGERPDVTDARWAIVPADELSPAWHVVTIAGAHPLAPVATGPLAIARCAPHDATVGNIDPAQLTTFAMTGTTAMARLTAVLMDRKGTTYPARDIAGWFATTDFVHVSNEVSFMPTCEPDGTYDAPFCSRERYIELLEAIHANVIELDGSHLSDFGWRWLRHSIEMYEARGWHFFGGGRDQLEATRPLELEHHGNHVALLGCNMPRSTGHTIRNGLNVGFCDMRRLVWQVHDLRARGIVPIVAIQHEEVYRHDPPDLLVRDFRRLAEAGAAVVFGSQAHWAHPWEVHAGAYLHYGAGNFFFDQSWPGARDATADRFYIYRGRLLAVDHLFTRLEERGRPRPMTTGERGELLRALGDALAKLPPARPWLPLREPPAAPTRPDSFLIGLDPVYLDIALPASDADVCTVTARAHPPLAPARLRAAIDDFIAAKYGVGPQRVVVQ